MTVKIDYATPPPPPPPPAKIKRDWPLFIAWIGMPILFAIIGWLLGSLLKPAYSYTASGKLKVANSTVMSAESVEAAQQSQIAALTNPTFIASVAVKTGIPSAVIAANLNVAAMPGSQLLRVGYTGKSAQEAYSVASTTMTAYCSQANGTSIQATVFESPRMPRSVQTNSIPLAGCCLGAIAGFFAGLLWYVQKRLAERRKPWFAGVC